MGRASWAETINIRASGLCTDTCCLFWPKDQSSQWLVIPTHSRSSNTDCLVSYFHISVPVSGHQDFEQRWKTFWTAKTLPGMISALKNAADLPTNALSEGKRTYQGGSGTVQRHEVLKSLACKLCFGLLSMRDTAVTQEGGVEENSLTQNWSASVKKGTNSWQENSWQEVDPLHNCWRQEVKTQAAWHRSLGEKYGCLSSNAIFSAQHRFYWGHTSWPYPASPARFSTSVSSVHVAKLNYEIQPLVSVKWRGISRRICWDSWTCYHYACLRKEQVLLSGRSLIAGWDFWFLISHQSFILSLSWSSCGTASWKEAWCSEQLRSFVSPAGSAVHPSYLVDNILLVSFQIFAAPYISLKSFLTPQRTARSEGLQPRAFLLVSAPVGAWNISKHVGTHQQSKGKRDTSPSFWPKRSSQPLLVGTMGTGNKHWLIPCLQNAAGSYHDDDTGKTGYGGVAADGQKAFKNYKVFLEVMFCSSSSCS